MATKPKSASDRIVSLVEAVVSLQSRGRSVVNGTVLVGSETRVFSHELSESEKSALRELIVNTLIHDLPV